MKFLSFSRTEVFTDFATGTKDCKTDKMKELPPESQQSTAYVVVLT